MFDSRLNHSFEVLNTIKNVFAKNLFDTIVHVNVKLKEAQSSGLPVIAHDKYCRGSKDYISLARELTLNSKPREQEKVTEKAVKATLEKKIEEEMRKFIPVAFNLHAPDAKEVYLVGDFNNWTKSDEARMIRQGNGDAKWSINLPLARGGYRYKFIVDDNWTEDPLNPKKARNSFGGVDSLIEVSDNN